MLLYIFYGEPHNSHVIQGSMISFSFINVETEAWKYGEVYPRAAQHIQPTFTSTVECFFFLIPGSFPNDYFLASVNKLASHMSTIASHLFCLHVSSAVSMKSGCLLQVMWNYLKNLPLQKFPIQVSIGSELHHKDRVW